MKASKEHKPQQSRVFQSGYNRHPIQCVRTIVIEALSMRPTHLFRDANKVNLRRYYKELNLKNDYDNYIQNGIVSWQLLNVPPPPNVVTFNNHGNQILRDESLILVSHGARYIPIFGYNFPSGLAKKLYNAHILPLGYRGEIYLDGCHTGEPGPFGHLGDGTSYAERFKRELIKLSTRGMFPIFGHFTVKGNLPSRRICLIRRCRVLGSATRKYNRGKAPYLQSRDKSQPIECREEKFEYIVGRQRFL